MRTFARLGALGATSALTLALAACGETGSMAGMDHGGSSSSASASPEPSSPGGTAVDAAHNAADTAFAQGMVVHHRGAIAMADLAATRASSPEVQELASRIEAAQGPEIEQMTGWLQAWGEPVPTADEGGMDHSATGGEHMPGMMSPEQVEQLSAAGGAEFDRLFLQMMTAHHQGAVEMAQTEQAEGSNPQAVALAETIETDQTAEIAEMGDLLASLG